MKNGAPITIHLGNQTRTLKVTAQSIRVAQRLLGGSSPRIALAAHRDIGVITDCAAAAFIHELGDKADPNRVGKWIDAEPHKYKELEAKTVEAYRRYYVATGVIPDDGPEGGAPQGEAESPEPSSPETSTAPSS